MNGDELAVAAPRVRASWARSERYGVSLDTVQPAYAGTVDTESLFYECGHEVLRGLQTTLANEPVSLMIADSEGTVLARLCNDTGIMRSLDRVYLAPGFSYAERDAGTNGLGLSLADRSPSLVRADEHYCTGLRGYTCAAVPVHDLATGQLAGSVNLTTWSDSSSELLLALAQAAAGHTASLMLAKAGGHAVRPLPRGKVARVYACRAPEPSAGPCDSGPWRDCVRQVRDAYGQGRIAAVVGESGVGKATLALTARHLVRERERRLSVRPPVPDDVGSWLASWTPELTKPDTCVVVSATGTLPAWAASELAGLLAGARRDDGAPQPFALTAESFAAIPEPLAALVDAVIEVPPLREHADDIMPLARHFAYQERRRTVDFTPAAERALSDYHWPGNVRQLERTVLAAAARTDTVDLRHLPPETFSGGHRLSRIQSLERDEIIRCLTEPGATMVSAAAELGLGRATLYRKIAQYKITVPGHGDSPKPRVPRQTPPARSE